jgi:hypothetical protein
MIKGAHSMLEKTVFVKRIGKYMTALFACATLLFTMPSAALSRPFRVAKTPDKGRNFGCATCHVNPNGGGERNLFGKDYEKLGLKAGDRYTDELGGLDSDGDGCTNDEEFAAGSHPGDPGSKPGKGKSNP